MNESRHLLIVDDDKEIRELLGKALSEYGYDVSLACNGDEMFQRLSAETPIDLIILDIMMPGEDGLSLCRRIRTTSSVPIIMLTAVGEDTDRIVGLEMGADDYVTKPFNPRELVARIKAVLRRAPYEHDSDGERNVAYFDEWTLVLSTRQLVSKDGVTVVLSSGEYILLEAFIRSPQRVLSRDHLLDLTRNRPAGPFDRSIDVQVSRLRKKIEKDHKNPAIIKTVRGGGYMFTTKVRHAEAIS